MPPAFSKERRKHQRYKTWERALATVDRHRDCAYHILDISRGGLALRHMGRRVWDNKITRISLFNDKILALDDLPVRFVVDLPLDDGDFIVRRRCSFQFGDLTTEQAQGLKQYIAEHTLKQE